MKKQIVAIMGVILMLGCGNLMGDVLRIENKTKYDVRLDLRGAAHASALAIKRVKMGESSEVQMGEGVIEGGQDKLKLIIEVRGASFAREKFGALKGEEVVGVGGIRRLPSREIIMEMVNPDEDVAAEVYIAMGRWEVEERAEQAGYKFSIKQVCEEGSCTLTIEQMY